MKAREIMTVPVVSVRTDTSVVEVAALLTERGIGSVPVLDADERVVGIVSEMDLIRHRMPHDPRSHLRPAAHDDPDPARLVRDVMSDAVVCMAGNADTADLAALMVDSKIRAVPIVDGARLVGIVSRRDLVRTLLRSDDDVRAGIVASLRDYTGDAARWNVGVEDGIVTIEGCFAGSRREDTIIALARAVPGVLRVHTVGATSGSGRPGARA